MALRYKNASYTEIKTVGLTNKNKCMGAGAGTTKKLSILLSSLPPVSEEDVCRDSGHSAESQYIIFFDLPFFNRPTNFV